MGTKTKNKMIHQAKQKVQTMISEHKHLMKEHRNMMGFHIFLAIIVGVILHLLFPPIHADDKKQEPARQVVIVQEHSSADTTQKKNDRIQQSLLEVFSSEQENFHIIPNDVESPEVSIKLSVDSHDGYNLSLITDGFEFQPKKVGILSDETYDEGHATLYINDQYIGRMYSPYHHISSKLLTQENNVILVTLNDNTHKSYVRQQQLVYDADTIVLD